MPRVAGRFAAQVAAAVTLFLAMAAHYVLVKLHEPPGGTPFDIYGYFVPIKLYAAHSLFAGGKGLLWTPFQSCGEPFFANTATGLLYPPHLLFLVLDPNVAVHCVLAFNMVVGAIGMLLLLRELGVTWAAAIAGALVFELGDPMGQLTIWSPMQNGSWAWVSWALFFCERLLRGPTRAGVIGLAAVVTMEILPGWVLITALTYQLIAFRIAWELITRRAMPTVRAVGAVAAALAVVPCLAAVQLIPAAEFANESFRVGVEVGEFVKFGGMAPAGMLRALAGRMPPLPFFAAILPLAVIAPLASSQRRLAVFWLLIGLLYAVLALGPATPLYGLYIKLPPGPALIRYAHRLFWISGFSLALLSAFAIHALTDARLRSVGRWFCLALVGAMGVAMYTVAPGDLRPIESALVAVVCVSLAAALWAPARQVAAWIVVVAIAVNLGAIPIRYPGKLVSSLNAYARYERSFEALRAKATAQDRVLFNPSTASLMNLSLMHKSASLVRVKEVYDYDALLVQRIVEYYNMLYRGEVVHSVEDLLRPKTKPGFRPRLLDLAAVHYVVTVPVMKIAERGLSLTRMGDVDPGLEMYRNDTALARARWVPRIEVVRDPPALLQRLAYGDDNLANVAFIENTLPSGFAGEDGAPRAGTVELQLDDPEHLIIDVSAPARGFLFLADQYYPGWVATVNGVEAPIVRANYAFRLIEVPAGRSHVEFRYRPASVAIGGAVSAVTLAALILFLRRRRRRA